MFIWKNAIVWILLFTNCFLPPLKRLHLTQDHGEPILNMVFLRHSFETQRNGLVFIYDMAGSNYTNFELDLSKKILNLLKVCNSCLYKETICWFGCLAHSRVSMTLMHCHKRWYYLKINTFLSIINTFFFTFISIKFFFI